MIVLGDVHRRWEDAAEALDQAGVRGRTIVQAGDFGLGFGDPDRERARLADLGAALAAAGNTLLVVRGNHDNPGLFRRPARLADGLIHVVPDYTVAMVEGHKILFAGGAISVDRKLRRAGRSYWPDEAFVLDLDRLATLDLAGLAAVVTHTAPGIAPPRIDSHGHFTAGPLPEPPAGFRAAIQRLYARDDELASDILAERRRLDTLYQQIRARVAIPHWIYGHFHHHISQRQEGTRFTMIDELQVLEVVVGQEVVPSLVAGQPLPYVAPDEPGVL